MDSFEFLLTFVSIIIAIGITDLVFSFHRLLRVRKTIELSWLPLIWSIFTFMLLIREWFGFEHVLRVDLTTTSLGFTILILPVFITLLMALAVLPDKTPKPGFSLQEWFEQESKYFFILFFLSLFLTYFSAVIREQADFPLTLQNLTNQRWIGRFLILSLSLCLVFIKNRTFHRIMAILFLIWILWMNSGQQLELQ